MTDPTPQTTPTRDEAVREAFDEAQKRAWSLNGTDEFVGSGYVKISIARFRNTDRLPELYFYRNGKRISRDAARKLVNAWDASERKRRANHG